ncbi:signal peptide protein [Rhodopirellula maiorica SM1]|uniref:Signal peptide protein n=1 Tax=Rhodopirellula maiorica SM1 TaxID=1265738 RepID=M5RU12_9BACT|nr:type III secretion system chaperone [Rhodopirellula maiorica]EMI22818.1 signal peptide protein [Rhodopirellula maiorica SM1]
MRYLFSFAVLAALFCGNAQLHADDNLFSEVAMESVFEKQVATAKDVATISDGETMQRIVGVSSLIQVLKTAGFEPSEDNGSVNFKMNHAQWIFPVSMTVFVDEDRIACEMSLVKMEEDASIDKETLLKLLVSNTATQGGYFAFDQENKRIQLRVSLSNRAVTPRQLKSDLIQLASLAERKSDIWSKTSGTPKSEVTAPVKPTNAAKSANPRFSLAGTWSASLTSGEAFALRLNSEGRFQLVHMKSGKATTSKGKVTRAGNKLTLIGDDKITLNCTVNQTVADKFQLAVNDAKGNVAIKLDFTKAK